MQTLIGRMRSAPSGNTIAERLAYYSMPEPNSGCLLWLGGMRPNGYGRLGNWGAHCVAWIEHHGVLIPSGMCVCHRCDVRLCIEPAHLFLGTHGDNARDRDSKGRGARLLGELQSSTKLDAASVLLIRADRRPLTEIAAAFGVHIMTVSDIKRGATWGHLDGPPAFRAHRWTSDTERMAA